MAVGIYIVLLSIAFLGCLFGLALWIKSSFYRNVLSWSIPLVLVLVTLILRNEISAGLRLLASTVLLLYCLKAHILLKLSHFEISSFSKTGLLIYFTIWPGMAPNAFTKVSSAKIPAAAAIIQGCGCMAIGLICMQQIASNAEILNKEVLGWIGIAALLLTIHFGLSYLLTGAMWLLGWNVKALFVNPFGSSSLRDFWSRRWNLAFVEMNHLIFLPLCRLALPNRFVPIGIFVISGILHEFALSFPGQGCYAGPFLYFLVHGVLVALESQLFKVYGWRPSLRALWVYGWIFVPLPLLFHSCFRNNIIVQFFFYLKRVIEL